MAKLKNWRVWAGIGVIFMAGVLTGILVVAAWVHHRVDQLRDGGPHAWEGMMVHALDWHLDFDDAQEEAVTGIINDVHRDLLRFKGTHQAEIEAIVGSGLERIEATLTEEQKPAWSTTRERIEQRLRVTDHGE